MFLNPNFKYMTESVVIVVVVVDVSVVGHVLRGFGERRPGGVRLVSQSTGIT